MVILTTYLYKIVRRLRGLCHRLVDELTKAQSYEIIWVGHSDVCLLELTFCGCSRAYLVCRNFSIRAILFTSTFGDRSSHRTVIIISKCMMNWCRRQSTLHTNSVCNTGVSNRMWYVRRRIIGRNLVETTVKGRKSTNRVRPFQYVHQIVTSDVVLS